MQEYQRPAAAPGQLRLHLNENTAGCSPRVIEAIAALTPEDVAFYPDYDAVYEEAAAALGVAQDSLLLVNGLDEGILMAAVLAMRERPPEGRAEAIVIQPAFDMYAISAEACGVAPVHVPPRPDFTFPLDATLAAVTRRTRVVYITSPNNPTGVRVSNAAIGEVARALPPSAIVFVDEAYHDFCGDTFAGELASARNVVVGRTFAKAHGLAALRVGALIGQPATLAPFRAVTPPYSLNVCAAAGLRAALADRAQLDGYVSEVRASRAVVYEFARHRGLEYWESGANFVLVRVGPLAAPLVRHLREQNILIRDKSGDPGCDGCIRITTGLVAHTERAVRAMEAFLASRTD